MGALPTRDFDLGDILSITTGRLVSTRHMDGVHDILNWMTGESLMTHQLPRVAKEAKPVLFRHLPQLAEIPEPNFTGPDDVPTWLAEQKAKFGDTLPVPKMTADEHEHRHPISELAEKVHPSRIVVVKLEGNS